MVDSRPLSKHTHALKFDGNLCKQLSTCLTQAKKSHTQEKYPC